MIITRQFIRRHASGPPPLINAEQESNIRPRDQRASSSDHSAIDSAVELENIVGHGSRQAGAWLSGLVGLLADRGVVCSIPAICADEVGGPEACLRWIDL